MAAAGAGKAGDADKTGRVKQDGRQRRLVTDDKEGGKKVTFELDDK